MHINTVSVSLCISACIVFVVYKLSLELQNSIGNNDNTVCGCVFFYVIDRCLRPKFQVETQVQPMQATSSFSTLSETLVTSQVLYGIIFRDRFQCSMCSKLRKRPTKLLFKVFAFQIFYSSSFRACVPMAYSHFAFLTIHSWLTGLMASFSRHFRFQFSQAIYLSFLVSVSSQKCSGYPVYGLYLFLEHWAMQGSPSP